MTPHKNKVKYTHCGIPQSGYMLQSACNHSFCPKNTTCYAGGAKKLYLCVEKENPQ